MFEVELKVPADHEAVRSRLETMGADDRGTVRQVDRYYDAPHRNFTDTDEALRLRTETPVAPDTEAATSSLETRSVLTFKGPRIDDGSKTRREVETDVADPEATEALLEGLGFDLAVTVEKRRDRYRLDDVSVSLDSVDGLGDFVEVETTAQTEEAVETAESTLQDCLSELGLDPTGHVPESYLELLLAEGEQGTDSRIEEVRNL